MVVEQVGKVGRGLVMEGFVSEYPIGGQGVNGGSRGQR